MIKKWYLLQLLLFVSLSAQDSLLLGGIPKWSQIWPYNMYCPVDSSIENLLDGRLNGRFPAGCVPVALSQILRYYRYPERGSGSIHYTSSTGMELGIQLDTCIFDWEHMPLTITEASSEIERQSVAKLISAVGLIYKTNYATNGTSAETGLFANYVSSMVGYSGNVKWYEKNAGSPSRWDSLLQGELKAGRPVLYSASSTQTRHLFVVEGYKKRSSDFYYFINPGDGSPGAWQHRDSIYHIGQIFNVTGVVFLPVAPATLPTPQNLTYSINDTGLFVAWDPVQDERLCFYQIHVWNADETRRGVYNAGVHSTRKQIVSYDDLEEVENVFPEGNDKITVSIVAVNKDSTGSCLAPWVAITRSEFISKTNIALKPARRTSEGLVIRRYRNTVELTLPEHAGLLRHVAFFTLNGACITTTDQFLKTDDCYKVVFQKKGTAASAIIMRAEMADGSTINRIISGIQF